MKNNFIRTNEIEQKRKKELFTASKFNFTTKPKEIITISELNRSTGLKQFQSERAVK